MDIWYIFPVLVYCTKKNLATLVKELDSLFMPELPVAATKVLMALIYVRSTSRDLPLAKQSLPFSAKQCIRMYVCQTFLHTAINCFDICFVSVSFDHCFFSDGRELYFNYLYIRLTEDAVS
jgi:hypothetical protein